MWTLNCSVAQLSRKACAGTALALPWVPPVIDGAHWVILNTLLLTPLILLFFMVFTGILDILVLAPLGALLSRLEGPSGEARPDYTLTMGSPLFLNSKCEPSAQLPLTLPWPTQTLVSQKQTIQVIELLGRLWGKTIMSKLQHKATTTTTREGTESETTTTIRKQKNDHTFQCRLQTTQLEIRATYTTGSHLNWHL